MPPVPCRSAVLAVVHRRIRAALWERIRFKLCRLLFASSAYVFSISWAAAGDCYTRTKASLRWIPTSRGTSRSRIGRCTEWRLRDAARQLGSHGGAAIGELNVER